ncbi:hypothetical protein QL285_089940 [Trifolium repens]|nr:hypothetical protein QL285_089940 [Trifolium repens]
MSWEFGGYEKIMLIEGIQVEFYWDVLAVLLSWGLNNNGSIEQGVFIFQVGDYIKGTMWLEMVGVQKRLTKKSMCDSDSNSTVLQWADENNSESCCGTNVANGFSLLPYAWTY